MTDSPRLRGVLSPVITPFDDALRPDGSRLAKQCHWLLENDVGLAIFGTNSEANSLSVSEKRQLLDDLGAAEVPAHRLMPGTGSCALPDSVELTRHAVDMGCAGVLMLPPFYYKGVTDEGLYRCYAELMERVGDNMLRVYLYHIPQVTQVPISLALIERLLKDYPSTIAGIKDSGGDWGNTKAMIDEFQPAGFDVFAGSEPFLLATLRAGGAGCISATANVNPAAIAHLAAHWEAEDADQRQSDLNALRAIFQSYPMIPALKAAVASFSGDASWGKLRPPLVELDSASTTELLQRLEEAGFAMPGLGN